MATVLQKLQDIVSSANSARDLTGIMQHMPLEPVQKFINESLKSMNEEKLRSIHFETSPIDHVIPHDVMQSALSFLPHQKSTKYVSKSFKKATEKNGVLYKRSREQMISSQFKGKNEWHLHGFELQKNDEPPKSISLLKESFDLMEDGDKLIIHGGSYEIEDYAFSKSIQIEGIGKCAINCFYDDILDVQSFSTVNKMSVKNILFQHSELCVEKGGSLYLTDCAFGQWALVTVKEDGILDCFCCHFKNSRYGNNWLAINVDGPSDVTVIDCVFDDCGGAEAEPVIYLDYGVSEEFKLKLIGNIFKNIYTSPIGGGYSPRVAVNRQVQFENNQFNNIKSDSSSPDILHAFVDLASKF